MITHRMYIVHFGIEAKPLKCTVVPYCDVQAKEQTISFKMCTAMSVRQAGPGSSVGRVSAPGKGAYGLDTVPRHTKVIKNGTSCSSFGTQIYGVE